MEHAIYRGNLEVGQRVRLYELARPIPGGAVGTVWRVISPDLAYVKRDDRVEGSGPPIPEAPYYNRMAWTVGRHQEGYWLGQADQGYLIPEVTNDIGYPVPELFIHWNGYRIKSGCIRERIRDEKLNELPEHLHKVFLESLEKEGLEEL